MIIKSKIIIITIKSLLNNIKNVRLCSGCNNIQQLESPNVRHSFKISPITNSIQLPHTLPIIREHINEAFIKI